MPHKYAILADSDITVSDCDVWKSLSMTIKIHIFLTILVLDSRNFDSKGRHNLRAILLAISLQVHDWTMLAPEDESINNSNTYKYEGLPWEN
jgi:hypothetical protein